MITFITGNQHKADYLAKYLVMPLRHQKVELDELQSLDLRVIVEHKVRQAYDIIKKPVIVEDVSLEFKALGGLPGPFIKFFVEHMPLETICRMVDGQDRTATGRCTFGYYDGTRLEFFEGHINGTIADHPAGDNGFGWDKIFVPEGHAITRASLTDEQYEVIYRKIKPVDQVREYLQGLGSM